jgi:hypothetical protein
MRNDIVAFQIDRQVLVLWRPSALLHNHTHFLSRVALNVLPRLAAEPSEMARLRGYLSLGSTVSNLSDHDVLRTVGKAIETGGLQAIVLGWFSPGPFAAELLKAILEWIKAGMSYSDITDRSKIFTNLLVKHCAFNADLLGYVLTVRYLGRYKYLSESQIDNVMALIPVLHYAVLAVEIAKLRKADIPGTDSMIYDLFSNNRTWYVGSWFQLRWVNNHLKDIKELERLRPKKPGLTEEKGPDAVMKNGDFIDTKSRNWTGYSKPWTDWLGYFQRQTEGYANDFSELRGHTLFFVFEGGFLLTTKAEFNELERKIKKYARDTFDLDVKFTVE